MDMKVSTPTIIGTAFEGGFYAGRFRIGTQEYALIVAPKAEGEATGKWGEYGADIEGARSCFDGLANTQAMAAAGSDLAKWALGLNIGGYTDWHLPSCDELEILYRNLKPTTEENICSFRDGDNASSVPPGYPYIEQSPAQTSVEAFQQGQPEAFEACWHWSSTQYSPTYAWSQYFNDGYQGNYHKDSELRARAVRKIPVSN
nr:DUF1566 domain-containing protein [uncultured Pseudogulbenkiania sp.]